jgi:hypothetical protein
VLGAGCITADSSKQTERKAAERSVRVFFIGTGGKKGVSSEIAVA